LVGFDKCGFGEVGFVGYLLHLFCSEVGGVSYYCELVALVFVFGKYVDEVEAVLGHVVHGLSVFGWAILKKLKSSGCVKRTIIIAVSTQVALLLRFSPSYLDPNISCMQKPIGGRVPCGVSVRFTH
jgi:hypothetical protein